MRVTQSMMNNQFLRNLRANNERMQQYQDMLSTGKRINRPADDPVGVSYVMRYEAQLGRNEQYLRNLSKAKSFTETTESTISKVNNIVQRARELALQGANDTIPPEAKSAIAIEVDQLYQELVQLGNTKFNDEYIFNGQMTDLPPYAIANAANQNPNAQDIVLTVADGVNININLSGQQLFGKDVTQEPDNLFSVLQKLKTELNTNNTAGVNQTIDLIDSRMTKVQGVWADVGARTNRLELVENRLKDKSINLSNLQSQVEDADLAEVVTYLKMAESVQRSSLATGARVLSPTLVDFLR